jgi:hypothetical protein
MYLQVISHRARVGRVSMNDFCHWRNALASLQVCHRLNQATVVWTILRVRTCPNETRGLDETIGAGIDGGTVSSIIDRIDEDRPFKLTPSKINGSKTQRAVDRDPMDVGMSSSKSCSYSNPSLASDILVLS